MVPKFYTQFFQYLFARDFRTLKGFLAFDIVQKQATNLDIRPLPTRPSPNRPNSGVAKCFELIRPNKTAAGTCCCSAAARCHSSARLANGWMPLPGLAQCNTISHQFSRGCAQCEREDPRCRHPGSTSACAVPPNLFSDDHFKPCRTGSVKPLSCISAGLSQTLRCHTTPHQQCSTT